MSRKNRASVAIIAQIQPAGLAPPREHFVERGVKFARSVDALVVVIINQQMGDVVDHYDLFQRVLRDRANGGGDWQNCRMIGADGSRQGGAKMLTRVACAKEGNAGLKNDGQEERDDDGIGPEYPNRRRWPGGIRSLPVSAPQRKFHAFFFGTSGVVSEFFFRNRGTKMGMRCAWPHSGDFNIRPRRISDGENRNCLLRPPADPRIRPSGRA